MEDQDFTLKQMILYKIDRSIAIIGVVIVAIYSVHLGTVESMKVASAALGGLAVYLGIKGK